MSQAASADSAGIGPPEALDKPLLETKHRGLLLLSVMVISIAQFLDPTIANVALPHMKVSLGASNDSIGWVLTSYIIGGAIFMPLKPCVNMEITPTVARLRPCRRIMNDAHQAMVPMLIIEVRAVARKIMPRPGLVTSFHIAAGTSRTRIAC